MHLKSLVCSGWRTVSPQFGIPCFYMSLLTRSREMICSEQTGERGSGEAR